MWQLTKCLLFWCMLQNMLFWPTNFYSRPWIFTLITLALLLFNSKKWFVSNISIIGLSLVTALLIADSIIISGILSSIAIVAAYLTGICLFRLEDNRKNDLLQFVTKWFGIIMVVSLGTYIIWLFIRFAPFGILEHPFGYYNHYNFIFFVLPKSSALITRFSGPFIEPGHLGMISVFIIYANKFDFKRNRYLWFILASVLFSLSLAGYVLLALAYILHKGIKPMKIFGITIIAISIFYGVTNFWNNGDNPVNEKIIERLQYDEKKGISGNNRNQFQTEIFFNKMVEDGSIIYGIGNRKFIEFYEKEIIGGAGITIYLIINGIIGLLLIFSYYISIPLASKNKDFMWKFFILICICFLQRAYPVWIAWLLPYMVTSRSKTNNNTI